MTKYSKCPDALGHSRRSVTHKLWAAPLAGVLSNASKAIEASKAAGLQINHSVSTYHASKVRQSPFCNWVGSVHPLGRVSYSSIAAGPALSPALHSPFEYSLKSARTENREQPGRDYRPKSHLAHG